MATVWFIIVAFMLTAYVVLDGFDIGAGVLHVLIARTDEERRAVLASIGPVWDGNEVWLIAAGGTLFLAFPLLYASSFSGFYMPLMVVCGCWWGAAPALNSARICILLSGLAFSTECFLFRVRCWRFSTARRLRM
jgi:cytochrome d oxidase subunit CydB